MKLSRKGFVASALLYVLLGLFLALMIGVVTIYANRKILMEKLSEKVSLNLEQSEKIDNRKGEREDYFKAARVYMKINKNYEHFNKNEDVSFIDINNLISEGLLPKDIISPLTNRKETTQNNYVVAVVNGEDYTFSYVDNATAKDYISVVNNLKNDVEELKGVVGLGTGLLDKIYPVGSIYLTTNLSTPNQVQSALGGSWQVYSTGRTLIGAGSGTDSNSTAQTFTVNSTGGEYTHRLTNAEMPSHGPHLYDNSAWMTAGNYFGYLSSNTTTAYGSNSRGWNLAYGNEVYPAGQPLGGNAFHNNLQPYIVTYMYKRIG